MVPTNCRSTPCRRSLNNRLVVLTIEVGLSALAATRFAISPLSETVTSLQQLAGQYRNPVHLRWIRWATDELAREPVDLSWTWPLLVSGRPHWPEFLIPAPAGPSVSIDADLMALQNTSGQQVRSSLRRVFGEALPPAAADLSAHPTVGLRAIASEMRSAYNRLVEPHWPRLRSVLEADIAYRAKQLASGGAEGLFSDLHPDLEWHDGRLTLGGASWSKDRHVNRGRGGLVLMPIVLGPRHVLIKTSTSTQTTIRYPARGVANLWTSPHRPPRPATVRLLGRSRAELLEWLRSPATTTDLAHALGVTPSAVSQHLRVLRENNLVGRERFGRRVMYVTTPLGDALLNRSDGDFHLGE